MTKTKMLFVRMKEDERLAVDLLAADYGMETSEFVRSVFQHIASERPALTRRIVPQRRPVPTNGHAQPK